MECITLLLSATLTVEEKFNKHKSRDPNAEDLQFRFCELVPLSNKIFPSPRLGGSYIVMWGGAQFSAW